MKDWESHGEVCGKTGVFFILLLTLPLVVFEGDFLKGSVAIT
ncbi:MAG: hypothetical protein N3F08_03650 [Crenarchaeota archaeon]|nr:hypothetical protein [Thermoproteota archaeon]